MTMKNSISQLKIQVFRNCYAIYNKMFKRRADPAFDMDAPVSKDDSVRDYQYYSYHAIQPNLRSRIELQVQDTSKYFLPCEAFIEIEGELVTNVAADTPYDNDDRIRVGFVNNGIMALFESAKYLIDGKEIESIDREVDVATTIIGLARYSDDYTRSAGPSMMFAKDTSDHPDHFPHTKLLAEQNVAVGNQLAADNPGREVAPGANFEMIKNVNGNFNLGFATRKGMLQGQRRQFSCAIPLHHIFGFCRNVRKVIYGAKHTIALVRKGNDNDAIWRANGVDDGKVILTKLVLWMPVLTPSITTEERLLSFMDTGGKSLLSWLTVTTDAKEDNVADTFTWHLASKQGVSAPRHIFIALQNRERLGRQLSSHMIFDRLGVSEVSLRINGQQEPTEDIQVDYNQNHVARVYHRMLSYMGRDQNVDSGLQISQLDFKSLYPIYYFSLEHLDLMRQSVVDIHFRARIAPAGVNYRAVAVILSDKSMLLEGVGGRMRLIDAPVENM